MNSEFYENKIKFLDENLENHRDADDMLCDAPDNEFMDNF